jgi:hypothetical protein
VQFTKFNCFLKYQSIFLQRFILLIMKFIPLILLTFFVFSCKKLELNTISTSFWNPKLAIPMAYGKFTINDILDQADSIDKYLDGTKRPLLQLSTSQSIKGFSLIDAVKIPDLNSLPKKPIYSFSKLNSAQIDLINSLAKINVDKRFPIATILQSFDNTIDFNQSVPLDFSSPDLSPDFRIDNVKFSNGYIVIDVDKGLPYETILKFSFKNITKNGIILEDSLTFKPTTKKQDTVYLKDCVADFSNKKLDFEIKDIILIPKKDAVIQSTDELILGISLTSIKFDFIQGYFGTLNVPSLKDSIVIDQLKDLKGKFGITNPSLTFKVDNSFGVPVELEFSKFQIKRKVAPSLLDIKINPFNIKSPESKDKPAVTSTLSIDGSVENLDKLLSSETERLQFEANVNVNKSGDIAGKPNFITSKSAISIDANITVPLTGYISGFTFEDTSDISLPIDMLKSLELKVIYKNTLPVDVDAKITFLDVNNNPIKDATGTVMNILSSSTDKLIKSPSLIYDDKTKSYILEEKNIASVPEQSFSILLKESQIPYLKNAKKVIFSGSFETFGAGSSKAVTLYDYYGLSVKLAGNAEVNSKGFLK